MTDTPAPAGDAAGRPLRLTHLDDSGAARMVDVSAKQPTVRTATATAFVACSPAIVAALRENGVPKGDALAVARIAGIAAAKRVPELLPLAHVIGVHACSVELHIDDGGVRIATMVRAADRTGVEMEALTAATVAGLALVDMVKGVDRDVALREARVTSKSGGRSGDWLRSEDGSGDGHAAPASDRDSADQEED
ncbi:cyclic pyranopterin monophosphate synthase MoaC [Actinomyces sp.]|uniref:cyclic pyranopterin monophosphate synthase MoaC n=1 Tax=Actinomyces sp. TaxID=29317 RepID=UPI0026DAA52B|nr:cyclic pyranopterin monophosphate synthase MoaC [Actinomyces sp.]MDO4899494.1 cyclic pyranopterin monophosphate synthase MoaC [Actinomyces sp.]